MGIIQQFEYNLHVLYTYISLNNLHFQSGFVK